MSGASWMGRTLLFRVASATKLLGVSSNHNLGDGDWTTEEHIWNKLHGKGMTHNTHTIHRHCDYKKESALGHFRENFVELYFSKIFNLFMGKTKQSFSP